MAAHLIKSLKQKTLRFLLNAAVRKHVEGTQTRYTISSKYLNSITDSRLPGRLPHVCNLRTLPANLTGGLFFTSGHDDHQTQRKTAKQTSASSNVPSRQYCDGGKKQDFPNHFEHPLQLMNARQHIWPHPIKTLRNKFFTFLISSNMDPSFTADNFLKGAEQAMLYVSSLIAQGNFDGLSGLVDSKAIGEIQNHYKLLTAKQRELISVESKDIFMRFIYEIGMIFDDDTDSRFVEITAVFHGIRGLSEAINPGNFKNFAEAAQQSSEQTYICNYRFIREYTKDTKDTEDEWTINKLNHFLPKDVVQNSSIFRR